MIVGRYYFGIGECERYLEHTGKRRQRYDGIWDDESKAWGSE